MGNKQSISQDFNMDVLNKNIQTSLTKNSTKASATSVGVLKMGIKVGYSKNCPITVNQKISSKVISSTDTMAETLADMKTEITSQLQNQADAKMKSMSGALSTNVGSKTSLKQKVNTSIKNVVEKTMSTENLAETVASSANIVGNNIEVGYMECVDGKGMDLTQDITSELVASAVVDALTENLAKDVVLTEASNKASAESVVENRGPMESAGAMISGILGSYTYIVALVVCLMCVACAGLVYVLMSPAGQNTVGVVGETAGYAGRLAANTAATGANPLMAFK